MEQELKVWQIAQALEERFPLQTQEQWDNSGLQVGSYESPIKGAVLALDVCDEVIDKAIETGSGLIITHHPLIFHPMKSVTDGDVKGRMVMRLIKEGISVYSLHTPADKGEGGLNDWISSNLGLVDPVKHEDGFLITGALPKPMTPQEFTGKLKEVFGLKHIEADFSYSGTVRIVSLCSGSGMSEAEAAVEQGADTLITGDVKWSGFMEWHKRLNICNITHFHSEKQFAEIAAFILTKKFPNFALRIQNANITEYW